MYESELPEKERDEPEAVIGKMWSLLQTLSQTRFRAYLRGLAVSCSTDDGRLRHHYDHTRCLTEERDDSAIVIHNFVFSFPFSCSLYSWKFFSSPVSKPFIEDRRSALGLGTRWLLLSFYHAKLSCRTARARIYCLLWLCPVLLPLVKDGEWSAIAQERKLSGPTRYPSVAQTPASSVELTAYPPMQYSCPLPQIPATHLTRRQLQHQTTPETRPHCSPGG